MKKSELRQLVREELKSILSESPRYASPGSYTNADTARQVKSMMTRMRAKPRGSEKTDDGKLHTYWEAPGKAVIFVQTRRYPSGVMYYRISFYD